jgi:hypothetical protein
MKQENIYLRKTLEIIPIKNGFIFKGDKDKIAQIQKTLKKISVFEEWKPNRRKPLKIKRGKNKGSIWQRL